VMKKGIGRKMALELASGQFRTPGRKAAAVVWRTVCRHRGTRKKKGKPMPLFSSASRTGAKEGEESRLPTIACQNQEEISVQQQSLPFLGGGGKAHVYTLAGERAQRGRKKGRRSLDGFAEFVEVDPPAFFGKKKREKTERYPPLFCSNRRKNEEEGKGGFHRLRGS